jgi:predicted O-methyltransferase YrrM
MINRVIQEVEGWLSEYEGQFLYDQAGQSTDPIVEIGSWKGRSTICLAKGSLNGNCQKIYAIDHFHGSKEHIAMFGDNIDTYPDFIENIAKFEVSDIIEPIISDAIEASTEFDLPIGLLFIDGSSEYDDVKAYFDNWYPKVVDGGIVAFHDYYFDGPKKFIKEIEKDHDILMVGGIAYFVKDER